MELSGGGGDIIAFIIIWEVFGFLYFERRGSISHPFCFIPTHPTGETFTKIKLSLITCIYCKSLLDELFLPNPCLLSIYCKRLELGLGDTQRYDTLKEPMV